MKKVYFDHAATTSVDPRVLKVMLPYFSRKFGNPSSVHNFGQEAAQAVEESRVKVAGFLGADASEVFFTSGATESDNLAIFGLAKAMKRKGGRRIITSVLEHPAVKDTCQALKKDGFEVIELSVDPHGIIKIEELIKAVTPETFLVTIMYVNNEIGSVQPIAEIGRYLALINKERTAKDLNTIYFHTDAVQAVNLFDCQVDYLKVDLLSLSGHKIYGPKGVGALYVRKGTPLSPIQYGGHQERSLRPGTINTPLIVGLGKAIELAGRSQKIDYLKLKKLSDQIINFVLKNIPRVKLNGNLKKKSPAHIDFTFDNVEGESLLLLLDQKGIAVSTGSACASGSLEPSYVLRALGLPPEKCHGSVRISLGRNNSVNEVKYFIKVLPELIKKIRARSPLK
ncbi:MAG: cysteine desulfurase family protein [Patescibacteria group bacterium]